MTTRVFITTDSATAIAAMVGSCVLLSSTPSGPGRRYSQTGVAATRTCRAATRTATTRTPEQ